MNNTSTINIKTRKMSTHKTTKNIIKINKKKIKTKHKKICRQQNPQKQHTKTTTKTLQKHKHVQKCLKKYSNSNLGAQMTEQN